MKTNYLIKKLTAVAVGTMLVCGISACGDSEKNNNGTAIDIIPATHTEAVVATTTEEATTTEATTTEEPRVFSIEDVNARNEDTLEWTEEDWLNLAGERFESARSLTWDYVEDPIYKLDMNEELEVDGKVYYESVWQDSIKGATEEYYSVFAHTESSIAKFNEIMLERDGKLYISIDSRDKDKYYVSTEIVSIDEYRTNMIFFTARSTYYDKDYFDTYEEKYVTQDRVFSLIYERGHWRVNDFTLPD